MDTTLKKNGTNFFIERRVLLMQNICSHKNKKLTQQYNFLFYKIRHNLSWFRFNFFLHHEKD